MYIKYLFMLMLLFGCSTIPKIGCPESQRINHTGYPWNDHDESVLQFNVKNNSCYKYNPELSCLIILHKINKHGYHAQCGLKR